MINRPQKHVLLPLLAFGLTLAMVTSVLAQERPDRRSADPTVSLQIHFGTALHWAGIQGTRVEFVSGAERPDYDMFRHGGMYYIYNNDRWYRSGRESGEFTVIDAGSVPSEFSRVPREHWRNYPSAWRDRNGPGPGDNSAYLEVNFRTTPRWVSIRGTTVRVIRDSDRQDYDMFRYGNSYYAYNNARWYVSRNSSGRFTAIDDRSVPREISRVPRQHWRNYPTNWPDQNDNRRHDRRGDRDSRR